MDYLLNGISKLTNRSASNNDNIDLNNPLHEPLNVLIIGETGSGKSTFINSITNYYRHGSLKSLKVSIPTKFLKATEEFTSNEFDIKNQSSSKTDSCNIYIFQDKE